ncbi:hypothetical protein L9F63_025083 [Diploptera punctata]|uniref:TERF2-interacting telomeric protein 1 n=1 Tax=Diploptera punctata TaxID=6984 RepID=A0AAD7ZCC6_DIPPU|nr:hypothetical protein L9F63_025083 [Diploptera punctata]
MEAKKICPDRTWQSLKEQFLKKILPNINTFKLSKEQVRSSRHEKVMKLLLLVQKTLFQLLCLNKRKEITLSMRKFKYYNK